jgi:phenylalanyl-tRNA synthetase alpha chain
MSNIKEIIYSLHPLEREILKIANKEDNDLEIIKKKTSLSEGEIRTGMLLLEQKKFLRIIEIEKTFIVLDKFGKQFLEKGLPEILLLKEIEKKAKKQSEINLKQDEISAAIGILKRANLLNVKKEDEMIFEAIGEYEKFLENNKVNPLKCFENPVEKEKMNEEERKIFESFKLRKGFLKEEKQKTIEINFNDEGKKIIDEMKKKYSNLELIETLNTDILKSGQWKDKEFRHYDISVETSLADIGRRHPSIEANKILSDIFVEMGFEEMQGPMVESAFWNMDVMWIPQDHPARDEQDTFYLKGNAKYDKSLIEKVKEMHENGINRTHTQKGDFSNEIASKRLLRTHSTATSFRVLNELGKKIKKGEDVNGKYFYVANNFRNEAVDATHLAEFFQAEGFIIGDDLSLSDLMGFIKEYYAKLGIHKIKFKPTFNPYTEPSMEAHYYDEKMGKWYSLINSGIFRPETLKPLGIENKRIIAWGIGASRLASLLSGTSSLRDITGFTCDYHWLKNRAIMNREIVRK